jgi:DnaK suppressor protein
MAQDTETKLPPDEYLSPDEVRELRTVLLEQSRAVLEQTRDTVSHLVADRETDADTIDVASNESDRDFSLRLAGRERLMLRKLQLALKRIEEGEYGTCETCGGPIGFKRLKVRPVATVCIDCKTQAEQLERRDRDN